MFITKKTTHARAHSFQALVDKVSRRYLGSVPLIAINSIHIKKTLTINNKSILILQGELNSDRNQKGGKHERLD